VVQGTGRERPFAGGWTGDTRRVEAAAQILANARFRHLRAVDTTCEAQRAAVAIADMIGGNLVPASVCRPHRSRSRAAASTASLAKSEPGRLVIFWGRNPAGIGCSPR
jgi:formylmethanofuran dehydrogenase subunit B